MAGTPHSKHREGLKAARLLMVLSSISPPLTDSNDSRLFNPNQSVMF